MLAQHSYSKSKCRCAAHGLDNATSAAVRQQPTVGRHQREEQHGKCKPTKARMTHAVEFNTPGSHQLDSPSPFYTDMIIVMLLIPQSMH